MRLLIPICLVLSSVMIAQPPVYVVTPDSAPPGVSRTLTVTATAPVSLSYSNCFYSSFHDNDAGRSFNFSFGALTICSPGGPALNPGQSVSQNFSVPGGVLPGTYWLKCLYNQGGTSWIEKWVDFRVDTPSDPQLSAPAPAWGVPWLLTLSYPTDPTAAYIAAASFGQDNRVDGGNFFLSLESDFLFLLSFPNPNPIVFGNFGLNGFNATGDATLIVNLPPVSGFYLGIHVQAAVMPLAVPGPIILSNCVDAVIQ